MVPKGARSRNDNHLQMRQYSSTKPPVATLDQLEKKNRMMMSIEPKAKIKLSGVEQTLLPMVLFKARDSRKPKPILGDAYAEQLLQRCDIDFEKTHFKVTQDDTYTTWIANRSKYLDQWTQDFLDSHTEPVTVLHLGCGLDCRYFRMRMNLRGPVNWIELDQPMVINLRRRLIPLPMTGEYSLRPLDVTSHGWFHDIPADRPTLIIAEGLTPYLEPSKGKRLFRDLVEYFGTSTDKEVRQNHIIFDTLGSLSVRLTSYIPALRSSRSAFRWGIDDPREVEDTHPRLQLVDRILWKEYMDLHPPFFGRYGTMAASVLPLFKKNIQFWRFRF